jgi:hypothetical protein
MKKLLKGALIASLMLLGTLTANAEPGKFLAKVEKTVTASTSMIVIRPGNAEPCVKQIELICDQKAYVRVFKGTTSTVAALVGSSTVTPVCAKPFNQSVSSNAVVQTCSSGNRAAGGTEMWEGVALASTALELPFTEAVLKEGSNSQEMVIEIEPVGATTGVARMNVWFDDSVPSDI